MSKMKIDIRTIPSIKRELKQCSLCGEFVLHGAVQGPGAELIFRAQVDIGGIVWVPLKWHAGPSCPDPGPETKKFWRRASKREAYKKQRRERAEAERMAH